MEILYWIEYCKHYGGSLEARKIWLKPASSVKTKGSLAFSSTPTKRVEEVGCAYKKLKGNG